ncbi:MAG: sensor histidine kinase, partial [bacterium]
PVDMKMLIEKVLDFNSQLADKKDIRVTLDSPPRVSTINVDRDMMEQAVLNLYSNAVKYSPEKARVTVRLSENEKNMIVEFEDTGFGISKSSLPRIFEKFYRIRDDDKLRDITGSGLGLSLVKEIIEIHGGHIDVESSLGKGSIFTVSLPKNGPVAEEEIQEEMIA